MDRKNLNRLPDPATCRRMGGGLLAAGLALGTWQAAAADFAFDGSEFHPVGVLAGDQGAPALALGATGGLIVWQDNATDGDGLGISARRITASGSALGAAFRVNELGAGDQEKPKVAVLPDGGAVIAWQGGDLGAQSVYARVLGPDGVFRTGDILLSTGTDHCQDVDLAVLSDGKVVVVWSSDAADSSMQGLFARRIDTASGPLLELIRVNQFTQFNQRSASVTGTADGGFVVTWVSEQQTGPLQADIFARTFAAAGTAVGAEFRVNPTPSVCSNPQVARSSDQSFWFVWSERTGPAGQAHWDVSGRRYDNRMRPIGEAFRLNQTTNGNQFAPKIAFGGNAALVVWTDDRTDGSGRGVAGSVFGLDAASLTPEWILNTTRGGDQIEPVVGSGGFQNWLTVWTDWTGYREGTDLFAQRVGPEAAPLEPMAAVFGEGISSWQVGFSWLAPSGVSVEGYEISFDDGTPVAVAGDRWSSPDVLPASSHTARLRYLTADGRTSPWSNPVVARSWGKDQNGDGLPDDWQQAHFGNDPSLWPLPGVDTDGDGVSNRNEFLAGTSPVDASEVLKVTVTPGVQGLRLDWNTRPGAFYQLQSSTDLQEWIPAGDQRLAVGSSDGVLMNGENVSSYYRVKRVR